MTSVLSTLPRFSSKAFLAPMAGVSDPALRLLCKEKGAGLVVTELTSIHAIIAKEKQLKTQNQAISEFIEYSEKERPLGVQLFGSEIESIKKAAQIVSPFFDVIDYNMGCPAPHITQQMAGGALLQNLDLTKKILETLVRSTDKPVTLKMRAGVDENLVFKDIAKVAEQVGIQMITLHARTVKQGYSGQSDWSLIKELKQTVDIPIVGNGDVTTPELAKRMIEQTGCDYIMIGRGAMGNPFLFEQVNDYLKFGTYKTYTQKDKTELFIKYLDYASQYKIKFSNICQQAMRFTKGLRGGTVFRTSIMRAKTTDDLKSIMSEISLLNL